MLRVLKVLVYCFRFKEVSKTEFTRKYADQYKTLKSGRGGDNVSLNLHSSVLK